MPTLQKKNRIPGGCGFSFASNFSLDRRSTEDPDGGLACNGWDQLYRIDILDIV
jgi:hypothetical protein